MKGTQNFSVVNLTQQEIPIVIEDTKTRYAWVPVGIIGPDDYFQNVTDSFTTSTTNAACIEGIADLIFGKGLYSKNEAFNETLQKIVPQEEVKKVFKEYKIKKFKVYRQSTNSYKNELIIMPQTF